MHNPARIIWLLMIGFWLIVPCPAGDPPDGRDTSREVVISVKIDAEGLISIRITGTGYDGMLVERLSGDAGDAEVLTRLESPPDGTFRPVEIVYIMASGTDPDQTVVLRIRENEADRQPAQVVFTPSKVKTGIRLSIGSS